MIYRDCKHLSLEWNVDKNGDICEIYGMINTCETCSDYDKRGTIKPVTANSCKIEALEHLVKLKDEYIELLNLELSGLYGLATVHGWKSSLVEEGKELRKKIDNAKKAIKDI